MFQGILDLPQKKFCVWAGVDKISNYMDTPPKKDRSGLVHDELGRVIGRKWPISARQMRRFG